MSGRFKSFLAMLGWWEMLRTRGTSRVLGLNGLVDAAGTGLAAMCLPFYLVQVAHLSGARLVAVLTVGGAVEILCAVPNGALAARFGVRGFCVATRVGQCVAFLALAVTHQFVLLLLLSALIGALRAGGGGLLQSLMTAALDSRDRTSLMAAVRAVRNVGYLASGAAGALMLGIDKPVLLSAGLVVNAVSFAAGAVLVRKIPAAAAAARPDRLDWSLLKDFSYLGLICCSAVFMSSVVVLDIALPLWVLRTGTVPRWTIGTVVIINTLAVIALQHRVASGIGTPRAALRALGGAAAAFVAMAGLIALSGAHVGLGAVAVLLAGGMLTLGEMLEGPAWWTLGSELSAPGRDSQYLAAFDLNMALVNIAGRVLSVALVQAGSLGWLVYGVLLLAAAFLARHLTALRLRHGKVRTNVVAAPVRADIGAMS
ncbi:hypothetical protein KDL01_08245 [Actinospica durhamensis]|uniref:MFS transporter n=1 Tax=Actinospica durhamensis TaxID=1508375 RepID=A0A941EKG9_9ACTN|nr:MFS transporter [Actinospica durhamensis]MBR7833252.1 hypothetical protein [Actinospica durhamensis]